MELKLQPEEADLLKRILITYLSDFRMERADTEEYEVRQSMKQVEATIKSLIQRLEPGHSQ